MAWLYDAQKVSCLYRLGGTNTSQLLRLDDQDVVTIGRQDDNDYVLTESPTVSRHHARLRKTPKGWLIEDAGSSNGVWINGVRLNKSDSHPLQTHDIVEIGKDPRTKESSLYKYEFYKEAKVKRKIANSGDSEAGPSRLPKDVPRLRRLCDEATTFTAQLRQKMMEQEDRLQEEFGEKERAQQEAYDKLRQELEQKEKEQAELERRIEKQQAMERAMEEMRAQLASKAAEEERLQKAVEEKQAEVQAQLEEKRLQQEEAQNIRETLEQEMAERLKEKDDKHSKDIETRIQALATMLEAKEAQQLDLQSELGTLKTQVEEEKKKQVEVKEQYMTGLEDAMEDELVCSVCAELLIQATSLNCSHSFCSLCIQRWMLRKKECPNCRKAITSCVPSLVLDNYINKVVTFLSEEMQERRKTLIEERKAEQTAFEEEQARDVVVIEDEVPAAVNEVTVAATAVQPLFPQQTTTYLVPVAHGGNTAYVPVTRVQQYRPQAGQAQAAQTAQAAQAQAAQARWGPGQRGRAQWGPGQRHAGPGAGQPMQSVVRQNAPHAQTGGANAYRPMNVAGANTHQYAHRGQAGGGQQGANRNRNAPQHGRRR